MRRHCPDTIGHLRVRVQQSYNLTLESEEESYGRNQSY